MKLEFKAPKRKPNKGANCLCVLRVLESEHEPESIEYAVAIYSEGAFCFGDVTKTIWEDDDVEYRHYEVLRWLNLPNLD